MSDKIPIVININSKEVTLNVESRLLLVDLLRNNLELKGTHIGCDTSQCGSCMVMIDGKCIKSCSILAVQCDKKSITNNEETKDMESKEEDFDNSDQRLFEDDASEDDFEIPAFLRKLKF